MSRVVFSQSPYNIVSLSNVQAVVFATFENVNVEHNSTPACRQAGLCHLSNPRSKPKNSFKWKAPGVPALLSSDTDFTFPHLGFRIGVVE